MKTLRISLLFICAFFLNVSGQNVSVLKDSVCVSNTCFELQELKIGDHKGTAIYQQIQKKDDLFNGVFFDDAAKRLKAKKDTLNNLISKDLLQESQYGFEKYKILYQKNGLLNVSVNIQAYGSSFEQTQYYFFDLNKDAEIGKELFINQRLLLSFCDKKIKAQQGVVFHSENLSEYILIADRKGKISGIRIIFHESDKEGKSNYEEYSASFTWKEIEKFIAPAYRNMLSGK